MNFEEILLAYIRPELLVLIPILWYIGSKIKDTQKLDDAYIPFILMGIAILFATSYVLLFEGFDSRGVWVGVLQGAAIAAFQGWLFQAKKQVLEKRG